jgi:hypothetical protein
MQRGFYGAVDPSRTVHILLGIPSEGAMRNQDTDRDSDSYNPETDPAGGSRTRRTHSQEHDPEDTERLGMSSEAAASDEAETMASTGNAEATFVDIAAGTATGLGIDRGVSMGTGGLAAGEDLDVVAEGDYWRENFRDRPYFAADKPYEHYEPGYRLGWEAGIDEQYEGLSFEEIEDDLRETFELITPDKTPWEEIRDASRDAFDRARTRGSD